MSKLGQMPDGYSARMYQPKDRAAIIELEQRQRKKWLGEGVDVPMADPDEAKWIATVVVVDANDRPVLCMGARPVAEVGLTIDEERLPMRDLMSALMRGWGKLAVALYHLGYETAFCRITSPTPRWGNTIEKRAGFQRDGAPHYYFDLEANLGGLKDVHK